MDPRPKSSEENDPLWDLLAKSPAREASPFFVSRTVNAARAESRRHVSWFHFLFRPALGLAAIVGLLIGLTQWQETPRVTPVANQDFEILSNLDNLIVMDTQVIWDDSTAYLNY